MENKRIKMVFDIEEELRKEFKIVAAKNGVSMKDVLVEAIKSWVKENDK